MNFERIIDMNDAVHFYNYRAIFIIVKKIITMLKIVFPSNFVNLQDVFEIILYRVFSKIRPL